MPWPTFWTEPSGEAVLELRRYRSTSDGDGGMPCPGGYHNASVEVGRAVVRKSPDGLIANIPPSEFEGDPRWPVQCQGEGCGYCFADEDQRQVNQHVVYRAADGREWKQRDLPTGAMYDAWWMGDWAKGADGICLVVMLPTDPPHQWMVDAEASNCTRKGDRSHKCWVRHGDPRTGPVTVDKNGETCAAGAGSIAVEGYHGFLQNGLLT